MTKKTGLPARDGYINDESHFRLAACAFCARRAGRGWATWWCACSCTGLWNWARARSISAQLPVVGFYARYGFKPCGEVYDEEGVPIA